ncbi:MotB family protein [Mesorhizobium sp. NBSH29]|uniref:MotB family protein n=1 Tax=Mesorhizobium sp. NBSH29 TaxID=2654249 RepID=UPI0018963FC4|nr:MotB family protein [Mesorhizobium sp. NBSH29]QPC85398.1 MotB family protein [Mesorhizobium sp. NBSH29]
MTLHSPDEHRQEIIIVRRHMGDHDEAHHGGVWKIAFADFMTAMMCFFLVMWLINAANDQTKASVASYFNPVKLVDRSSGGKGLDEINEGPSSLGSSSKSTDQTEGKAGVQGNSSSGPTEAQNSSDQSPTEEHSDKHLFADPYAVLAEIAADTSTRQNVSSKGEGGAQDAGPATGASGGTSFRDPFAPDFWSQQIDTLQTKAPAEAVSAEEPNSAAHIEGKPGDAPKDHSPLETVLAHDPAAEKSGAPSGKKNIEPDAATKEAAAAIKQELAQAFEPGDKLYDGLSVTVTDKGVTISVTDQLDFGMFEIGSAVPHRELVLAMEKISRTLSNKPGKITISGHTDGRQFHSENYDNWRLSTARAHSAYYMLVRGGLDEARIKEVAGYADRELKVAGDPFDAHNRRIEIVLEPAE